MECIGTILDYRSDTFGVVPGEFDGREELIAADIVLSPVLRIWSDEMASSSLPKRIARLTEWITSVGYMRSSPTVIHTDDSIPHLIASMPGHARSGIFSVSDLSHHTEREGDPLQPNEAFCAAINA